MGFIWPDWSWPEHVLKERPAMCSMWIVLCVTTAIFPVLDVNQSEHLGLM
jgi:hypothetical protein